jgi:adenosylhomocysteine nucleosidase
MQKYLIAFAMREECQGLFEKLGVEVLYTGLGKINATYALTKELQRWSAEGRRPEAVLNFGTAGSAKFKTHELIECTRFLQRDMDVTALGLAMGVTPFDSTPGVFEVPGMFRELDKASCGTGDSFETGAPKLESDVVDMEAYAIAKICHLEKIPFACVKYISDGSDHKASDDWKSNLPKAAARFIEAYQRLEQT